MRWKGTRSGTSVRAERAVGILRSDGLRFRAAVATGGIGSGRFFLLEGSQTLTREESRGGRFLDRRDYCKGHIVCHYLAALLGPELEVSLVGAVGEDEAGARLLDEMRDAGIDLRYVRHVPGTPTLFSFCLVYPDGSGGNLTTSDSASSAVGAADVERAAAWFDAHAGAGLAIALPEVPLAARLRLLRMASERALYRVASFTSQEMPEAVAAGALGQIDLLGVNMGEARALLDALGSAVPPAPGEVVLGLVDHLRSRGLAVVLVVTAGAGGSYSWWGDEVRHEPALPVDVATTAGAGDAHLAGVLAGVAAGRPPEEAHRLGALVAAASVTSPHTIAAELDAALLERLAARAGWAGSALAGLLR